MSSWQDVGQNLEAKVTRRGQVLFRDKGQTTEYPHLTVDVNSQGKIINWHHSEESCGTRFGSREAVLVELAYLKKRGLL
ncbi:hypothetical protein IQ249_03060 [Lusitaniella coriacea LEGE 07157]|uniref:Uncharacterized protein n=1 Tax=Lusitaniella coriacea LEGE 07157 TaxID=945747 RepID=A0A8J7AYF4_9CYAN|nr:hypothetical protein [Lusitaniella coriacea]MBE9114869.1 hypothetical protein [Lusitaniella coriacea LEGE 07157]